MSRASPVNIVGYVEDANLRLVSWNQEILEREKNEAGLKHGQAILYINKARNRFRMIANFYGLAVLVLPPVDPVEQLSLYLKISRFLRKFSQSAANTTFLDHEIEAAQIRLRKRQKARVRAARASAARRRVK